MDSLADEGVDVSDGPAGGDLSLGGHEVLVGTVSCPIRGTMAGRASRCGDSGAVVTVEPAVCGGSGAAVTVEPALLPVVGAVASPVGHESRSVEPRLKLPPLCDDGISLIGRREECSGEHGLLGRLLCEDPSLLVGSLDCRTSVPAEVAVARG